MAVRKPTASARATTHCERAIFKTEVYRQSRPARTKVEMPIVLRKRILKLGHSRLRGASGAHNEFLMAADAQNQRKMAKELRAQTKIAEVVCS